MKPSYYLVPDAGEMLSFFHSLPLREEFHVYADKIHINKILIDEAENGWEFEYSFSTQPDSGFLDSLSEFIKNAFNLKTLAWKRVQGDSVSVSGPAENVVQSDDEAPETGSVYSQEIPLEEIPPDADCELVAGFEEDENYIQAYNALYGNKYADGCLFGKNFKADNIVPLNKLTEARRNIVIQGHIGTQRDKDDKTLVPYMEREIRGRNKDTSRLLIQFNVVDANGGIYVKVFFDDHDEGKEFKKQLKPGLELQLLGNAEPDKFNHDAMTFAPIGIKKIEMKQREDKAPVKRVELHCHTKMSKLDAIIDIKDLINTAIRFGHKALAITDHGVIQAFPFCADAVEDAGSDLKLIYGCEGYLASDADGKIMMEGLPHAHRIQSNHIIILAKDYIGLRNLYKLVTLSHLSYMYGSKVRARPLIPRSVLEELREGLLLGSACEIGELYQAIEKGKAE